MLRELECCLLLLPVCLVCALNSSLEDHPGFKFAGPGIVETGNQISSTVQPKNNSEDVGIEPSKNREKNSAGIFQDFPFDKKDKVAPDAEMKRADEESKRDEKIAKGSSQLRGTTTLSIFATPESTTEWGKKKSANRRKEVKQLRKIEKEDFSPERFEEKLKKILTERNNVTLVSETRRKLEPRRPFVYTEESGTTGARIKKYGGIDRKPSAIPKLRNLRIRPEMELLHYDTLIRSRYVRTTVTGVVKNYDRTTYVNINEIIPRRALITDFKTYINGKVIEAIVSDQMSTIHLPKSSADGLNVGTILVEARDCDAITLAVQIPASSTMAYTITYEYLLERDLGFYSVPITIHNNMWINDLMVRWRIKEERNLTRIETPLIYRTTALPLEYSDDPMVCLVNEGPGTAELIWEPTISEQKNISRSLGKLSKNGVVGILELRYDVRHDQDPCGQVVEQGGYFAQFFSAPEQPPLAKHVVFVLDVSDSMQGDPIKQLKTAIYYILDTLQPIDNFTLINFSDEVNIMNIYDRTRDTVYRGVGVGLDGRGKKSGKTEWPGTLETYEATPSNIEAAKEAIKNMDLRVFTNIYDALVMGFKAVKDTSSYPPALIGQPHPEPLIVFLTDGHASDGPSFDHDVILKMVEDQYLDTRATVFALGFGAEADMRLLRKFALATNGIEKHIYKDVDAADQLVTFFQSIKSPVLRDLFFKYNPNQVITSTLTDQSFSLIHHGKEVTIAGELDPVYPSKSILRVDVTGLGRYAAITCQIGVEESRKFGEYGKPGEYPDTASARRSSANGARAGGWKSPPGPTVERIWAFKMLSRLRDEIELDYWRTRQRTRCDDSHKPIDRMLEICLRLNFAMPTITNLVYGNFVIDRVSVSPEREDQIEDNSSIDPLAKYSWIVELRDRHGFAKLPIINWRNKARMYAYLSLGVSENPSRPPRRCARSFDGSPGVCRYLPECPDPRLLATPEKFQKYFCRLGSYAGVCCPRSMRRMDESK